MEIKEENELKALTPQQERFCHEYLKDRNGTQAAIRARYSRHTAQEQASRLLSNVMIKARVNELIAAQINRLKLSADLVIKELLKHATIDIADAYDENGELKDIQDMPEPLRKAIIAIETEELFEGRGEDREHIGYAKKIKICDKTKTLELLGKHLKMFTDVTEHRGLEGLADRIKEARMRTKHAHNRRGRKG